MRPYQKSAIDALKARAARARELAEKLDRYVTELTWWASPSPAAAVPPDSIPVSLDDRYTWAINDIENFIRNVNFAELARHAARIDDDDE